MQSTYNFYSFSWRRELMEAKVPLVLESHNVALGKAWGPVFPLASIQPGSASRMSRIPCSRSKLSLFLLPGILQNAHCPHPPPPGNLQGWLRAPSGLLQAFGLVFETVFTRTCALGVIISAWTGAPGNWGNRPCHPDVSRASARSLIMASSHPGEEDTDTIPTFPKRRRRHSQMTNPVSGWMLIQPPTPAQREWA